MKLIISAHTENILFLLNLTNVVNRDSYCTNFFCILNFIQYHTMQSCGSGSS
jgi:hypothetical protein